MNKLFLGLLLLFSIESLCAAFIPQSKTSLSQQRNSNGVNKREHKGNISPSSKLRSNRVVVSANMFSSGISKVIESSVAGGVLSGSLHAITGPDHVAAVLPASVGGSWFHGMKVGATWGLGHGISATMLGLAAMVLKGQVSSRFKVLESLSTLAESAVGFSLIFIGLMGIKESIEARKENDEDNDSSTPLGLRSNRAILTNGILHGCSLDGAPSIAPVLAMKSRRSAVWFLVAYCFGTMAAMSVTAGAIAESSNRLVQTSKMPDLPSKLCFVSSFLAMLVGIFWVVKVFI